MAALWVGPPKSFTPGRQRAPQYVVLHYTAGSEGPKSAENGAAYDKSRGDGTSTHYFVDSAGPPLQEVAEGDRSHTALYHGNQIGIHIEICGTRQSRAQWLDTVSLATLRTTAALTADICKRRGFAVRRLSVAETRAAYYNPAGKRPTGITDHWTITRAYPEDAGDHTDVGEHFPWDVFMQLVEGTDMYEEADRERDTATTHRALAALTGQDAVYTIGGKERREVNTVAAALKRQEASNAALTKVVAALTAAVAAIGKSSPEVAAILKAVEDLLAEQSRLLAAEIQGTAEAALEAGSAGVRERHPPTSTSS